jgi:hypothetical protein
MEWRFKQLTRDDTLQNASHLEFFHNEALNSAVDALVREDIQNRLDARARNEPVVEVRYRLCGPAMTDGLAPWFKGLKPHLDSPQISEELGYRPTLANTMTWLVIEDFHTTGLEGDPECFQDPEDTANAPRNDFFWFIRNVGRSGKKGGDRGRWGLGKIVYPATSRVRSFFALSQRRSDGKRSLIGRSVLAVHHVSGRQHSSEGYFGRFEHPDYEFFATPCGDEKVLDQFQKEFHITRDRNQPGLSIVIPWPEPDITYPNLVLSLIEHWFWVLLEGRLQVRVAVHEHEIFIAKDTLEAVIQENVSNEFQKAQMLRRITFAKRVQALTSKDTHTYTLNPSPSGYAPKWDSPESRFSSPELLAEARSAFHAGNLLSFQIPVNVCREDGTFKADTRFTVHLQRSEEPHPAIETFLREGLTISGQQFMREPGVIAAVMPEEFHNNPLGTLLGDAENPAHTRWEQGGKHFKGRYKHGPSILIFVKRSAQSLVALLTRRAEGRDPELLKDLFNVPQHGDQRGPRPGGDGKPKPPAPLTPPPAPEVFLECKSLPGGFRIRPNKRATRPPMGFQLRAAYEVARGNPFKLYHPADFDFTKVKGGVQLDSSGVSLVSCEPNRIVCQVDDPEFELCASGFDQNRDLIVRVEPIHDQAESESTDDEQLPTNNAL